MPVPDTPLALLTREFLGGFFRLGFLTDEQSEVFRRTVIGVGAGIAAFGLLMGRVFLRKYGPLSIIDSADAYHRALLADQLLMLAVPMIIVSVITVVISRALFPDETDFRVLGPLPVSRTLVFSAKLIALGLFAAGFVLVIAGIVAPFFVFSTGTAWQTDPLWRRLLAHVSAAAASALFSVCAVCAVQGLVVVASPRDRLQAAMTLAQTSMVCALVLAMPVVNRIPAESMLLTKYGALLALFPPAWFLGLEQTILGTSDPLLRWLTQLAGFGSAGVLLLVAASYARLYGRFEQLMVPLATGSRRQPWLRLTWRRVANTAHPARQAIIEFALTTLRRGMLPQAVAAALFTIGLALAFNDLLSGDILAWLRAGAAPSPALLAAATRAPFFLMLASVTALRGAMLCPVEQSANWIFRIAESGNLERANAAAVDALFIRLGVLTPMLIAWPLQFAVLGIDALLMLPQTVIVGALMIELVQRNWHRVPFTCPTVPGRRHPAQTMVYAAAILVAGVYLPAVVVRFSIVWPWRQLVVTGLLVAAASHLRATRLSSSGPPLVFQDQGDDSIQTLQMPRLVTGGATAMTTPTSATR